MQFIYLFIFFLCFLEICDDYEGRLQGQKSADSYFTQELIVQLHTLNLILYFNNYSHAKSQSTISSHHRNYPTGIEEYLMESSLGPIMEYMELFFMHNFFYIKNKITSGTLVDTF